MLDRPNCKRPRYDRSECDSDDRHTCHHHHHQRRRHHCNDAKDDDKEVFTAGPSLLSLSDDVLLMIFSRLEPKDLLSLSRCCQRISDVSSDRSLWEDVEIPSERLGGTDLVDYLRFINPKTKRLRARGPRLDDAEYEVEPEVGTETLTKEIIESIRKRAVDLECLVIENHTIDGSMLTLEEFPSNLKVLRFVKCRMISRPKEKSYFYKMDKLLPNLQVLDLTDNFWFVPHTLLALSKSARLEQLILKGCDVSDCLPYASLAANFGFTSLRTLDLRNTRVSDIEVTCFNRTFTLRDLYLEAPPPPPQTTSSAVDPSSSNSVTDYSITTFGGGHEGGGVVIEVGPSSPPRPPCLIETLVLVNYSGITDRSLAHIAANMKSIKYLDITDTSVTTDGVENFTKSRPNVKLIYNTIN